MAAVPPDANPQAVVSTVARAARHGWMGLALRVTVIVAVIAISVAIFLFRDQFSRLAALGYPGIFVVSLLGNATIILPAPYLLLVFSMGSALPPLLLALAAGTGAALGELTGYAAGFGGRAAIERRATYERLMAWMQRHGAITIFLLSLVPNPVVDLAGIAAGTLRYPLGKFLLFCWLGKTLKMWIVAWAGAQSLAFMEQWIR